LSDDDVSKLCFVETERSSGVPSGVGAREQGILTAPPKKSFQSFKKLMTFFIHQPLRNTIWLPPSSITYTITTETKFCVPFVDQFDPQHISKYIPVSSFCAPFFTCARGQPPSPVPPRYATGYIHY